MLSMTSDSYFTVSEPGKGLFKDKGSKFLAFAYHVSSEEQVKEYLIKIKKEFHDARHHCYAYKMGLSDDKYRMNDDGEPSGTAGKPIYGQILSNNLSDILIVVVRYFGGTLLGTSGLINAYKNAALDSIKHAIINEHVIKKPLVLAYTYELMSAVMRIVKDCDLEVVEQNFTESCQLKLNVRLSEYQSIKDKYDKIYGVGVNK